MGLIKCPDCGKDVSDRAERCIHCGCPINPTTTSEAPTRLTPPSGAETRIVTPAPPTRITPPAPLQQSHDDVVFEPRKRTFPYVAIIAGIVTGVLIVAATIFFINKNNDEANVISTDLINTVDSTAVADTDVTDAEPAPAPAPQASAPAPAPVEETSTYHMTFANDDYFVQSGSYPTLAEARHYQNLRGGEICKVNVPGKGIYYRLLTGPYTSAEEAAEDAYRAAGGAKYLIISGQGLRKYYICFCN